MFPRSVVLGLILAAASVALAQVVWNPGPGFWMNDGGATFTPATAAIDGGVKSLSETTGPGIAFNGFSAGECNLSSGKCNAVVPGCQGSWECQVTVQGSTQGALGCQALADAGSASAFCTATDTGKAALFCYTHA